MAAWNAKKARKPTKTLKQRLVDRFLRSMTPEQRAAAKADKRTVQERIADLRGWKKKEEKNQD